MSYTERHDWVAKRVEELRRDKDVIAAIVQERRFLSKYIYGVYTATSEDYISRLAEFCAAIDYELRDIAESEYAVKQHCLTRSVRRVFVGGQA